MKLKDLSSGIEVLLPDTLMWSDEFKWSAVAGNATYSLGGALLIEESVKLSGRSMVMQAVPEMGWVSKDTVSQLQAWANTPNQRLHLTLNYPNDVREFDVIFRRDQMPVEAAPVLDFVSQDATNWHRVIIRLLQVT